MIENLGPDVPLHFTAFHPDFRMLDVPPTPPATLTRARRIALANGVRYAYTGNVHGTEGGRRPLRSGCGRRASWCATGTSSRDYRLSDDGRCRGCGTRCPGVFEGPPGTWGPRFRPVHIPEVVAE